MSLHRKDQMHRYQVRGSQHIVDNLAAGVFMDMGLGKTVTTLTAANRLMFEELDIRRVLVVATKKIVDNVWAEECQDWEHLKHIKVSKVQGTVKQRIRALATRADIYLISRDNIKWLCEMYRFKLPFDMLVVDESSSFKNPKSQRFKALRKAAPFFRRRVMLTGTPAPNGLEDIWAQIFLLDRGERLEKFITRFRDIYFKPDKRSGHIVYTYKLKKGAERVIYNKIDDICISMKAEDYLTLPKRINVYADLNMSEDLTKRYDDFEEEQVMAILESEEEITAVNAAALNNKLQQFSSGVIYDEDRNVHHIHDIKLDYIEELVEASNGEPILIGWAYQHERDRLMTRLAKYGVKENNTKQDVLDWNEGKIPVMLMHPLSGGHGLNLQKGGHIVIWASTPWALELYQQFIARVDRQGQDREVIVYHPTLKGTLDSKIIRRLADRDATQEDLMQAVKMKIKEYGS